MLLRGLSLCSGLAGLELGLKMACDDYVTGAYCERDSFAVSVLRRRIADGWLDDAAIYDDVETFSGEEWRGRIDIISAGFPCQPWSLAGKRAGTADERWLWPAIAEIIRVVRPRYVFLENVSALISGGGMALVLADLAALGFDAEWDCFRASDVGAPHRRERVFILADAGCDGPSQPERRSDDQRESGGVDALRLGIARRSGNVADPAGSGWASRLDQADARQSDAEGSGGRDGVVADRLSSRLEGRRSVGGDDGEERVAVERSGDAVADAASRRGSESETWHGWQGTDGGSKKLPFWPPGPADRDAWRAILDRWPDLAPAVETQTQSRVRGVADGTASRVGQLKAYGNAVVPLVAALAFRTLAARLAE